MAATSYDTIGLVTKESKTFSGGHEFIKPSVEIA
jgi:hypothetical protein